MYDGSVDEHLVRAGLPRPREETEAWLRASYPDTEISRKYCSGADACAEPRPKRVPKSNKDGHRLADAVRVELDDEDGGVTHVRISGWTG